MCAHIKMQPEKMMLMIIGRNKNDQFGTLYDNDFYLIDSEYYKCYYFSVTEQTV